ncbi:hypothetical protein [Microbacterium testaceum]|uniref:hypothetical protein n=1 Tax=Microbacterium testaceum TaxID=2033 RepID=UPI0038188493
MPSRSPRPIGFALSLLSAALVAAPTLLFPADSPTEPKLVFAVVGAAAFFLAILRIRREPAAHAQHERASEEVSES